MYTLLYRYRPLQPCFLPSSPMFTFPDKLLCVPKKQAILRDRDLAEAGAAATIYISIRLIVIVVIGSLEA